MFSKMDQSAANAESLDFVELPEQFGGRFLVTVDTEEEFDWNAPFEREGHTTISVSKLVRFQEFVQKFKIKPIYFVDYSIIEDDDAVAFLKSIAAADTAAIGVHLHPWINPPFEEETNNYNSFAGNLSKELEEEKITRMRDAIAEKTGVVSKIYRAGRYGVGPNTIEILSRLGFAIDGSVRSRFDYSAEGGPDFKHIGPKPFWLNKNKNLMEIPLTTVFSGVFRQQSSLLSPLINKSSLLNALLSNTRMLERIPLTPEGVSAREAKEAIDVALDDDLKLLVFSFHSPSLSPGHTPYVRTSEDLDGFYDWWREIIGHLEDKGLRSLDINEMVEMAKGTGKHAAD